MSKLAIQVENLGKEYRIGARQEIRTRLSEQIVDAFVSPFRRMGKLLRGRLETAAELEFALISAHLEGQRLRSWFKKIPPDPICFGTS